MLRLAMTAVLVLAGVLAPSPGARSPYASALSARWQGIAAEAKPGCVKMACNAPDSCADSRNPTRCGLGPTGGCATFHC